MRRSAVAYIPVNLVAFLVSFGTIIVLTRLLTAEEFGRYALVIVTLNFIHMGLFTWLEASMARFRERAVRTGKSETHEVTLLTGAFLTLGAILPVLAGLIWVLPIDGEVRTIAGFAAATLCAQLIAGLSEESHKADLNIHRYSVLRISRVGVGFVMGVGLILFTPLRESGAVFGLCIGGIIAISLEAPKLYNSFRRGRFEFARLSSYLKFGAPLGLTLVISYMLEVGDLYLIGWIMGDAAVGSYNAGYGLTNNSIDYLFIWLAAASMPLVIATYEKHGARCARQVLLDYGDTLLLIILPAAVGLAFVSGEIGFLFGPSVRDEAVSLIPWVAVAAVMNGLLNLYIYQAFVLSERLGLMSGIMLGPVLLNIGLNLWLIPAFGLYGAVAATLCCYLIAMVAAAAVARRHFPLPMLGLSWLRCGLATIGMAIVLMMLPFHLVDSDCLRFVAKVATGVVTYAVFAYLVDAGQLRSSGLKLVDHLSPMTDP